MNKKYIIQKSEEIEKLIKNSKKKVSKYFIIYYCNNTYQYNRYCISVSKKIGKAHIRNKYKRRIKDILIKNYINSSVDYVIILRNAILELDYSSISNELIQIMGGRN